MVAPRRKVRRSAGPQERRINAVMSERVLARPKQHVMIAVSGGQDSACLVRVLDGWQLKWAWTLGITHCDHNWNSGSKLQSIHVSQLAAKMQLDCYSSLAVDSVAQEGAARIWRYSQFYRIAMTHHYAILVTAHTASDRIETLLHHLLRGSGADGLQSLAWKRDVAHSVLISRDLVDAIGNAYFYAASISDIQHDTSVESKPFGLNTKLSLIRPLLSTTRNEVRQLCQQWHIPVWPDPTNADLAFRRNHIRHSLLPYLKHHFEPRIDSVLARWAELVHAESSYLDRVTIQICEHEIKAAQFHHAWLLRADLIRALPLALQRRVLKRFVELLARQTLTFAHIEHIRMLCLGHSTTSLSRPSDLSQGPKAFTIAFPSNARLQVVRKRLVGWSFGTVDVANAPRMKWRPQAFTIYKASRPK